MVTSYLKPLVPSEFDRVWELRTMSLIEAACLFMSIGGIVLFKVRSHKKKTTECKEYSGSCHCKAVTFSLTAPRHLKVWDCNCSICQMKKNWHFIIPSTNFRLLSGREELTEYRFNTKVAKHMFCKHCGVQAYYVPRSNPDGVAVTLACIPEKELDSFEIVQYNGQNWEGSYASSNISKYSASS